MGHALAIASAAIDDDDVELAVQHLAWAKDQAPRVPAVREAYGIALYLGERYAEALTELQAYRRLSARTDQDHLVADCMRATGKDLARVVEAAGALVRDERAPADRRAEAVIVVAGARADAGQRRQARALLAALADGPPARLAFDAAEPVPAFVLPSESRARVLSAAAALAELDGDLDAARHALDEVLVLDPEDEEARERRGRLNPSA